MDDETRAAFAETHRAFARIDQAFARVDRYFELNQAQVNDMSARIDNLDGKVDALDGKVDALDGKVTGIDNRLRRVEAIVVSLTVDLRALRDWCAGEFNELKAVLRQAILSRGGRCRAPTFGCAPLPQVDGTRVCRSRR